MPRLGRPFHEHPEQIAIAKGPASKDIAGGEGSQRGTCADQHGNPPNKHILSAYMRLSTATVGWLLSEDRFLCKPPIGSGNLRVLGRQSAVTCISGPNSESVAVRLTIM
jgi:hypothetical protein